MARRGSPALYELLGRGRESKATPVIPVNIPPRPQGRSGRGGATIGPGGGKPSASAAAPGAAGSSPTGMSGPGAGKAGLSIDPKVAKFVGFAIAAGIVLLGVYWLGVARGTSNSGAGGASIVPAQPAGSASVVPTESPGAVSSSSAPNQFTSSANPGAGADSRSAQPPTSRPSDGADPVGSASNAGGRAPGVPAATPRLAPAATNPELGPALPPAQRGIDPRQAGLNYYVIASVAEANADKLVAFCRERGLDAWVVPDHNGRLREITVLPGIPSSEKKGAVASALEERIRKVGQQWQAAGRGNSDFNDRYLKLFNG